MEKVTQTTAATAEESAAASEELTAQAEGAMQVVGRLETLVGSASAGATAPSRPRPCCQVGRARAAHDRHAKSKPVMSAEDELPMEDTGTFGKF